VENATQYDTEGNVIAVYSENQLDPLNQQDTVLGEQLKQAYSRGSPTVQPVNPDADADQPITPTNASEGLGEVSVRGTGEPTAGLRLPTFAPGLYDFPALDDPNVDAYTTARVLGALEAAGRAWAKARPDTHPLESEPAIHAQTDDPEHTGNLRFGINDISPRGGGVNGFTRADMEGLGTRAGRLIPNTFLGHASHQNGLDLDMRYAAE